MNFLKLSPFYVCLHTQPYLPACLPPLGLRSQCMHPTLQNEHLFFNFHPLLKLVSLIILPLSCFCLCLPLSLLALP